MIKRILSAINLLLFSGLLLTSPVSAETIKVGVLLPLSGKLVNTGDIELVIKDTAGKPEIGKTAIKQLISEERVSIIGGGVSSQVTLEMTAVAQKMKTPFLVNSASSDKITNPGYGDYIFRLNPSVNDLNKDLMSFLNKKSSLETAVILYEKSSFGIFETKKMLKVLKKIKFNNIIKIGFDLDTVDFEPILTTLIDKKIDILFLACRAEKMFMITNKNKECNVRAKLVMGSSSVVAAPNFSEISTEGAQYICSGAIWDPSLPYPDIQRFCSKFFEIYMILPDYHAAEAYSAMYVIADALKRSKSFSTNDIRDSLEKTDCKTITGQVKFMSDQKNKRQNIMPSLIIQWIDGKTEIVWPEKFKTHHIVYPLPET